MLPVPDGLRSITDLLLSLTSCNLLLEALTFLCDAALDPLTDVEWRGQTPVWGYQILDGFQVKTNSTIGVDYIPFRTQHTWALFNRRESLTTLGKPKHSLLNNENSLSQWRNYIFIDLDGTFPLGLEFPFKLNFLLSFLNFLLKGRNLLNNPNQIKFLTKDS